MFERAVKLASKFTRSLHTITRAYGTNDVEPGAATLFFVNDEGWALTCKHVTDLLVQSGAINQTYENFKATVAAGSQLNLHQLELPEDKL